MGLGWGLGFGSPWLGLPCLGSSRAQRAAELIISGASVRFMNVLFSAGEGSHMQYTARPLHALYVAVLLFLFLCSCWDYSRCGVLLVVTTPDATLLLIDDAVDRLLVCR